MCVFVCLIPAKSHFWLQLHFNKNVSYWCCVQHLGKPASEVLSQRGAPQCQKNQIKISRLHSGTGWSGSAINTVILWLILPVWVTIQGSPYLPERITCLISQPKLNHLPFRSITTQLETEVVSHEMYSLYRVLKWGSCYLRWSASHDLLHHIIIVICL